MQVASLSRGPTWQGEPLPKAPTQIEAAFADLRSQGWVAKGPFRCCTEHGFEAMIEDDGVETNFVFYSEEDAIDLLDTSSCFLCWRGDPDIVMKTMARHGLMPIWSRRPQDRIQITWTRRH